MVAVIGKVKGKIAEWDDEEIKRHKKLVIHVFCLAAIGSSIICHLDILLVLFTAQQEIMDYFCKV
jgi:hypothetical protein